MGHLRRFARGFAEIGMMLAAIACVFGFMAILFGPLVLADLYDWRWLGLYVPMVIVAAYFIGDDR